ncbi:MAG: MopE-related protein, partial [Flavobacteriales bacterium]
NIDENGGVNTYYADTDGDGFGDPNNSTLSCTVPVGFVTDNTDCDDTNNTIYPGATEFCDGIDTDCDLILDNGFTGILYYADTDNDTYGDPNNTITSCILVAGYVTNNLDCDDTNAAVNPAATEVCDGFDNDCDTQIDEGFTQNTYYADNDGDGFGDANMSVTACSPPSGYVVTNTDCDDTNNNVFPGAPEQCDGLDNDCDTQIDEGLTGTPFYADTDGDGFGDASNFVTACVPPTGYVADNTDCDDTNNTIYPGATELCDALDNDCDFVIDNGLTLTTYYLDFDGDGFGDLGATQDACVQPTGYVTDNTDCDDNNAASFPGNPEVCDGIDNDCDFVIDNGFTLTVYYADLDGDGFGDPNNTIDACAAPSGYVTDFTDCDDTNADIYPGAAELCDGLDNDCDEVIDNGLPGSTYYADLDGDGFGDPNNSVDACVQPTGYVTDNTDCDDANAASFPGNPEICDGIDNDCDFVIDNGFTLTTFFADLDGDGFGDPNNTLDACAAPTGYVSDNTDCDDANAASFPGNPEVCDGIDNDCDFVIDNGFTLTPFYADLDGDGYGDPNNTVDACAAPSGYVSDNTDCDDTQNTIYPGAVELCDGFDNNCDTQIDEGLTLTTYYADLDGDGYGDPNQAEDACSQPTGYVTDNTDCDDTNAAIFPGNPEVCDGLDNNCDTAIDEGLALTTYYADLDGDGFGDPNNSVEACSQPTGYVSDNTDCDDTNGSVYPGAEEVCDSIDNDCDTEIDEGLTAGGCVDTDGDTVRDSEDIDDDNDGILDATELSTALNNGDTDGDGIPDIIDLDSDNDGIADVIEAGGTDPDSDGVIGTGPITDVNGDGLADVVEPNGLNPADTDADGLPDFQDIESDGDGINDSDEIDTDGDAIGPDDTDGDGVPDYQDPDDDGDGLLTSVEYDFDGDGNGPDDCDYDGLPNYLDADQCELFFPEGFSPNGDGINDTYIIEGVQGGTEVSFEVFNRWGAVVYTANPYTNDWDGTSNTGSSTGDLPVGTYYYIVKIGTEERVGYLTLWR